MKYTLRDLSRDFPDEQACLLWLFNRRYPEPICPGCGTATHFYPLKSRPSFSCASCRYQIHPRKGTIFEASSTPLTDWYHAIYLMATNKAGTSARELERELGVTYKTAWRMLHLIRGRMTTAGMLSGDIEADETFIHPNSFKRSSARLKYGYDARRKGAVIFGMVERGGGVRVMAVPSTGARVLLPLVDSHVTPGSTVHTDGYLGYRTLKKRGYTHRTTDHGKYQFYTAQSHTQNIENFWSTMKPRIRGTYKSVSPKYLQNYSQEYAYRYNHRNDESIFWSLMDQITGYPPEN